MRRLTLPFQSPRTPISIFQIATSFGGYLLACATMYVLFEASVWLALIPAPLAAAFLVRIFIIQHDCGHGSFFRSRLANTLTGLACSLFTFAPYLSWRRQHAGHHGIWNDLDRRESGADIYSSCLTLEEYRELSAWQRLLFRVTRHPLVANVMLPPMIFVLLYRLPFDMPRDWKIERLAVHLTTLALVALFLALGFSIGFAQVITIQLSVIALASIIGVWLFSVQHRGKNVRWARHENWNATDAAMEGTTYLRLPAILQWFTGNIGFHHVHHLNPRVPNYQLQACHETLNPRCPVLEVSLFDGLSALRFTVWDEERGAMMTTAQVSHP